MVIPYGYRTVPLGSMLTSLLVTKQEGLDYYEVAGFMSGAGGEIYYQEFGG